MTTFGKALIAAVGGALLMMPAAHSASAKKVEFKSDIEKRIERERALSRANRLGRQRARAQRQRKLNRSRERFDPSEIWRRASKSGSNDD
ncbi:MAG: hypothetical protein AAFV26_10345 [Pseudomonadota bacterium]